MINIIHGSDFTSSRDFLNKLALKFQRFNAVDGSIDELRQELSGNSMFGSNKNILIENLFSKKAKNFDEIIKLINETTTNIYIYDSKEIGVKNLKLFPKSETKIFSLPKVLFSFLDSIYPKNTKIINLFNSALESSDIEILIFMIIRQLRLLLAIESNAKIEEAQRLAPWQISKLKKQASFFSKSELKDTYKKIYEIDLAGKSGGLSLPLKETIDIFLLNL